MSYVFTVVKYSCDSGYQLEGRSIGEYEQWINCTIRDSDGVPYWEGLLNLSACIPINCESPPSFALTTLENITIALPDGNKIFTGGSPYFLDSQVTYSCAIGYIFNHTGQISAPITCHTVPGNTHAAAWEPLNIGCIRM